jgi:hypothetical protein
VIDLDFRRFDIRRHRLWQRACKRSEFNFDQHRALDGTINAAFGSEPMLTMIDADRVAGHAVCRYFAPDSLPFSTEQAC